MYHVRRQGGLIEVRPVSPNVHIENKPPKRGDINEFSAASRRRLIKFMSRLETRGVRATFLTLTLAEPIHPRAAKVMLKAYMRHYRSLYPSMSGVWRMEFQERGVVHFHLILFRFPYVPQAVLQSEWQRVTKEPLSIVHVKLLRGYNAVKNYVSKYVAKYTPDAAFPSLDTVPYWNGKQQQLSIGRFWGWVNFASLPLGVVMETYIDEQTARYLRWFLHRGLLRRRARWTDAFWIASDDAESIFLHAGMIGGVNPSMVKTARRRWVKNARSNDEVNHPYIPMSAIRDANRAIHEWNVKAGVAATGVALTDIRARGNSSRADMGTLYTQPKLL